MWPFSGFAAVSRTARALPPPTGDCFQEALNDAEELLKYAAEIGKCVPAEIILRILNAREASTQGVVDQRIRSDFYAAYTALSNICGDVTARTIRFCSAPATWRALSRNRVLAVVLTVFIAGVSVITFVTDDMSKKIVADIATANNDAAVLRTKLTAPERGSSEIDVFYAQQDPCLSTDGSRGGKNDAVIRSIDDVTLLQQFSATMRELLGRSLKLNAVILRMECDPFNLQSCIAKSREQTKPTKVDLDRRLEINPAITNYTAEVLCKIRTYQDVRTFASNVQGDYAAIIGAIASFALPVLYSWLGSFAYRLRQFGDTIRKQTYHPSFADSARMITAIIAGAIVGLFNPSQGISLSPLATAFLVGYGVELFFRFLDTLINFGSPPAFAGTAAAMAPALPMMLETRRLEADAPKPGQGADPQPGAGSSNATSS